MNLAKISANGQITVPVEIRRQLGLKSGDKILFLQKHRRPLPELPKRWGYLVKMIFRRS